MKGQLYICPENGRYYLRDASGKRYGHSKGYATYKKASAVRNWLINGKEAIAAQYRAKQEMYNELKHFKNI